MATRIAPTMPNTSPNKPVTFSSAMPLTALLGLSRQVRNDVTTDTKAQAAQFKVALLANHSTQFLKLGLELAMASHGVPATVLEAPFDQWHQELLDPMSSTAKFCPDVVVLSFSSIWLAYREAAGGGDVFALEVEKLISNFTSRTSAMVLVSLPEPLEEEFEPTSWSAVWRQSVASKLLEVLNGKALLLDLTPLIIRIGSAKWYASRFTVHGKFLANPDTTAAHADYLARQLAAMVRRPVRLVIVDLDNTLWSGVVGEDGWQGVGLDLYGAGYAHIRLQRFLLGLHEKGVLLAVVSKNNYSDAVDVFRNRKEMLLREEHFSDIRINWEPKSQNVKAILATLNLTERGTVFLDDSAFEREEVRRALSGVNVPEFPADIINLVPQLLSSGNFAIPLSTSEDLNRQQMYKEEASRQKVESALGGDINEYYALLNLELMPKLLEDENLQRAADLLAKTNQFNLTTRRHTFQDLISFQRDPSWVVFTYSLLDRHGAYGLISVLVAEKSGESFRIDSWVMSCRAMGRTAERGIFEHFVKFARDSGIKRLIADFFPTSKNVPVANLYPEFGFVETTRDTNGIQYTLDIENYVVNNPWVRLIH